MAGSVRSTSSMSVRRKKRGESDEAYTKRMARLEQKRESEARRRVKASEEENSRKTPANRAEKASMTAVLERSLEEQSRDRSEAEAQVAALVKQLERERQEHARQMQALIAAAKRSGEAPNRDVSAIPSKPSDGVEIIDLTGDRGQNPGSHEIIEVFVDRGQGSEIVSTMDHNPLNLKEKTEAEPVPESDPAFITPSGYKSGATHRVDNGFRVGGAAEQSETKPAEPPAPTLAELSEMVLLVGWLESARRAYPDKKLVLRFGPTERRLWREVTLSAAEFCGGADLAARTGPIPFVRVLSLTLRYVLDRLPPLAPLADVCLSCSVNLARPHPRGPVSRISNLQNADDVKRIFADVRSEVSLGTLVILEGSA